MKKFELTKDTILKDILNNIENSETVLLGFGMHCLHCPHSIMESLEEACEVHEIDVDLVIEKLKEIM